MHDLYDQVEDERAGGATLEEAATKLTLPYRVVEAVSADLKAPDGSAVADIPNGAQVVKEAFESDVGVENSPIRGSGESWVFFDVLEIMPARDRTLDEVRDEVVGGWTAEETQSRIAELADSLFERLKTGAPLASLAAEIGKPVQTVEGVKRSAPPAGPQRQRRQPGLCRPGGPCRQCRGRRRDARILLKVDKVTAPAFFAEAADAKAIQQQLSQALRNDLLATYNRQLLDSARDHASTTPPSSS